MGIRHAISRTLRSIIYDMFDGSCMYCGAELDDDWHIDHIMPVSRGGQNNLGNLGPSCRNCNLQKSDYTVEEYRYKCLAKAPLAVNVIFYFELVNGYKSIPLPECLRQLQEVENG